jgi:FolB domain-containing protein
MSDTIFIHEARFPCHIGITPEERSELQDVLIDVDLGIDLSGAGASDSIQSTVNYVEAWETLRHSVSGQEFRLVEALATAVGNSLLDSYAMIEWVAVRVTKPAALASRGVVSAGVQVTVTREHG